MRGALLKLWREARERLGDPVAAWAEITGDPAKARAYKRARGKGGLVRADWDEVTELVAAAQVHTVKAYGPDRVAGFSPIPAMSMASFAAGSRFMSLIGGTLLSFYDWYADLPVASPQVFGDQTDVPEAADWWNAGYLIMWGSNIPVTRTPDAHFLTESRYKRHQGRRRQPGLRRQRQARRRVGLPASGHRRRAGDGHGPCDPAGVPGRPRGAVLPGLPEEVHRRPVPDHPARAHGGRSRAGRFPDRRRPRSRGGERRLQDRPARRGHG
ncbi:hypothetical protein GCM10023238_17540 [Streptomyces heliomycini]